MACLHSFAFRLLLFFTYVFPQAAVRMCRADEISRRSDSLGSRKALNLAPRDDASHCDAYLNEEFTTLYPDGVALYQYMTVKLKLSSSWHHFCIAQPINLLKDLIRVGCRNRMYMLNWYEPELDDYQRCHFMFELGPPGRSLAWSPPLHSRKPNLSHYMDCVLETLDCVAEQYALTPPTTCVS